MRDTRLIFVDGLPGAGKSTTAEYVTRELEQRGIPCRLLREREPDHPLNVGGEWHPSGRTTGARMFAEYTVGAFVEESLARWSAFATQALVSERVNVLDSYPFQNSVRVTRRLGTSDARERSSRRQPLFVASWSSAGAGGHRWPAPPSSHTEAGRWRTRPCRRP